MEIRPDGIVAHTKKLAAEAVRNEPEQILLRSRLRSVCKSLVSDIAEGCGVDVGQIDDPIDLVGVESDGTENVVNVFGLSSFAGPGPTIYEFMIGHDKDSTQVIVETATVSIDGHVIRLSDALVEELEELLHGLNGPDITWRQRIN